MPPNRQTKYADDKQRQQAETMALYKEHGVNVNLRKSPSRAWARRSHHVAPDLVLPPAQTWLLRAGWKRAGP